MRNRFIFGFVAALGWSALASLGFSQGISLGDYLGEAGRRGVGTEAVQAPGKLGTVIAQGVLAHRNKEYDRAIDYFTNALQMNPDPGVAAKVYACRAEVYVDKRQFEKAIPDATQAIRLDPRLPFAYNARGVAYGSSGDISRAIVDFDAALRLDPNFKDAQHNRALAEQRKKKR